MSEYKFDIVVTGKMYYNEATNWGVFSFQTKTEEDIPHLVKDDFGEFKDGSVIKYGTLAGSVQYLDVGEEYEFIGFTEFNKKYKSYNFVPKSVRLKIPTTLDEQAKFLESVATQREAGLILAKYPNVVQMILDNEYIDISDIKGIGSSTISKIRKKILENYILMDLLVMLNPYGVNYNQIKKISELDDNPMLIKKKIEENPYVLTALHGMGFKKVDNIALKINPDLRVSELRAREYIKYVLDEFASGEGHTLVSKNRIIAKARKDVKSCVDLIKAVFEDEEENRTFLFVKDKIVGNLKYYYQELSVLNHLNRLENAESRFTDISDEQIEEIIKSTEEEQGFPYTDDQKQAIFGAVRNNVIIISGNAGAGKTTVVNGIVNVIKKLRAVHYGNDPLYGEPYSYERYPVISQCSLSAKASRRMVETTGRNATTIHRLLGYKGGGFEHNVANKLNTDVVIADELSMNNISINNSLFQAIPDGSKLILVFDYAQLPPIGSGAVAYDLLEHSDFTKFKFTKVHRQAEKSGILMDANRIRQNKNPLKKPDAKIVTGELKDMIYMFMGDRTRMRERAIKAYVSAIEKFGIDNVSIIVPRKKAVTNSTNEINKIIQDLLIERTEGEYIKYGEKEFRVGDKVIQKVNNYDYDVVNGEMGTVEKVFDSSDDQGNKLKMMRVNYGKDLIGVDKERIKYVEYEMSEIIQLELAYALTVHSYQGSQNDVIIGIMDSSHFIMLDSTILYTLMTRASKRCLLITDTSSFMKCVTENKTVVRDTFLSRFLTGELEIEN